MKKVIIVSVIIVIVISGIFWKTKTNAISIPVKRGDVVEAIYGLGKVKSNQIFEIKIGVITNIQKLFVEEGQFVQKGHKLISFESAGTFKAPFSGTVTNLALKEGEIALPNIPILKMINLKNKYVEVSLEQNSALKVQKGNKTTVIFDAQGNKKQGLVKSIYPRGNEFIAHIEVQNIEENILPEMTADTVIFVGEKKNAILIPVRSYHNGFVTRVREGKKKKIEVQLGHADGRNIEVISGDLTESDSVIIPKDK